MDILLTTSLIIKMNNYKHLNTNFKKEMLNRLYFKIINSKNFNKD